MSIFFFKRAILTSEQLERISNIFDNAGQVILGVIVFSPLINGKFDISTLSIVLLGIVSVGICWTTSIFIAKRKNRYEF